MKFKSFTKHTNFRAVTCVTTLKRNDCHSMRKRYDCGYAPCQHHYSGLKESGDEPERESGDEPETANGSEALNIGMSCSCCQKLTKT